MGMKERQRAFIFDAIHWTIAHNRVDDCPFFFSCQNYAGSNAQIGGLGLLIKEVISRLMFKPSRPAIQSFRVHAALQ